MEPFQKKDDCYFYYYSSCMKAGACPFRHEPAALGTEAVCNYWKQGKCFKAHCNFRHMEVRKNRNVIPCYWESQPGGCRKPHCLFQHKNARDNIQADVESTKDLILPVGSGPVEPQERSNSADRDGSEHELLNPSYVSSPPVDPLVVNVEEESDNESVPSTTPVKRGGRSMHIKTLEEIRLERIQAESAAFYQYDTSLESSQIESPKARLATELELRKKLLARRAFLNGEVDTQSSNSSEFKVLSLEEIRLKKRKRDDQEEEEVKPEINKPVREDRKLYCPPSARDRLDRSQPQKWQEFEEKSPSKRRSHSPVVFDVKGENKKQKSSDSSPEKTSPQKPIVAVAARKRPHCEENIENSELSRPVRKVWRMNKPSEVDEVESLKSCLKDREESDSSSQDVPSTKRPTRKIWRPSRQVKAAEEQESSTSVFTRKLRLKKSDPQSDQSDSVPDSDSTRPSESTPKLARNLHVVTTSQGQGDLDVELSLLSPSTTDDLSLGVSRGADDILQDIDDLLND